MAPPAAAVATPTADVHRGVKHLLDSTPSLRTLPSSYIVPDPSTLARPTAAPPTTSSPKFPIIDVSKLNSLATRASVMQDITSACANGGFFLVVNHNIKPSTITDFLDAAAAFFALPLEEKMKYATDFHDMAPVSFGSTTNTEASQPRHFWRDYLRHFDRPVDPVNCHLWPTTPENYTRLARELLKDTWELAVQLAGAIAEGLGKDTNYVTEALGEGLQALSCNYYPPCPQPELAMGVGAHIDPPAISVLMDNHVDGLQFKGKDGEWVPVPRVVGSLVVSMGSYLEKISGGEVKAGVHRVVVNEKAVGSRLRWETDPNSRSLGPIPFVMITFERSFPCHVMMV